MKPLKSALIIGCGYVGQALKAQLAESSWQVITASRSRASDPKHLPIDVTDPFRLDHPFELVVYLVSAGSFTPEAYQRAYITGVKNSLDAVHQAAPAARFLHVSSTSVFAEDAGGTVDEGSPTAANSFSKEALLEGEQLVANSGLDHAILRLSGIYGPGRMRLVEQVAEGSARLKLAPVVSNRIHREDCAGMLHHLATLKNPQSLYIGTDSEPTPYNDIVNWLAKQLGAQAPRVEDRAASHPHRSNKRCQNKRIVESGYEMRYPNFRVGFADALENLARNNQE